MQISLKADFRQLQKELGRLSMQEQSRVISAAMNKATAKGMTTAKREIARTMRVKQSEFARGSQGRRMFLRRASRGNLQTSINAVGRPFNLTRFGATQTATGVQASVMGRTRNVPGAFRMNARGGPIMRRRGKARFPLDQIWGASAADALRLPHVQDPVYARVRGELRIEYERAIKREMARIRRRVARSGG